jgi:hypothetical protein
VRVAVLDGPEQLADGERPELLECSGCPPAIAEGIRALARGCRYGLADAARALTASRSDTTAVKAVVLPGR